MQSWKSSLCDVTKITVTMIWSPWFHVTCRLMLHELNFMNPECDDFHSTALTLPPPVSLGPGGLQWGRSAASDFLMNLCLGLANHNTGGHEQKCFVLLTIWPGDIILFTPSPFMCPARISKSVKPPNRLQNPWMQIQPHPKDLLLPPALTAPSASPPPPSERPVVTAGNWAGSEKRPESCSHPRAQRPASPLCSPGLRRGPVSWLLSRFSWLWRGGSRFASDPGPACWMLLLLMRCPHPPPTPLGRAVPIAWRNNWRALQRF